MSKKAFYFTDLPLRFGLNTYTLQSKVLKSVFLAFPFALWPTILTLHEKPEQLHLSLLSLPHRLTAPAICWTLHAVTLRQFGQFCALSITG